MTMTIIAWLATATAVVTAMWAGVLGVALSAPRMPRTLGDAPSSLARMPVDRAVQVSRIALLVVSGAAAAEAIGWWYRSPSTALGRVAVSAALLYMLAEGLPRAIAALLPRAADGVIPFARLSLAPFAPLLGLLAAVESWLHRLIPAPRRAADRFGPEHRDMLLGVFSLGETTVAEVMTPRLDMLAVDVKASWREVLELLSKSEHARIPVFEQDLDSIVGVLYAKDLTPAIAGVAPAPDRWQELARPAAFVPESKTLTTQLRDFQRGPSRLAIVVDEFGGTSGVVTLEDVLEEIVGEIHDESDVEVEPAVEQEGNDKFWVDGRLPLDDLSELIGESVEHQEVSTVGGLVYSELGRVPSPGEELRIGHFRVVVERVVKRRIQRVYFERLTASTAIDAGDSSGEHG